METEYKRCDVCGNYILPRTYEKNRGRCAHCPPVDYVPPPQHVFPADYDPDNDPRLVQKQDPIDVDPEFKWLIDQVNEQARDAAIEELNLHFPEHPITRQDLPVMGFCHLMWHHKKRILKEKHGIDWKSPTELNPDWMFD